MAFVPIPANGWKGVGNGLSIEPSFAHRADEIRVRDREAGRGAYHCVDATMRAESRSADIFHPFPDIIDREDLLTEEAATNVATF